MYLYFIFFKKIFLSNALVCYLNIFLEKYGKTFHTLWTNILFSLILYTFVLILHVV